jgi:hypothetical protein
MAMPGGAPSRPSAGSPEMAVADAARPLARCRLGSFAALASASEGPAALLGRSARGGGVGQATFVPAVAAGAAAAASSAGRLAAGGGGGGKTAGLKCCCLCCCCCCCP